MARHEILNLLLGEVGESWERFKWHLSKERKLSTLQKAKVKVPLTLKTMRMNGWTRYDSIQQYGKWIFNIIDTLQI